MIAVATRALGVCVAAVLVCALAACASIVKPEPVPSDSDATPVVTIRVIDNQFDPSHVEIEVGQAVRWVFEGTMQHDVVAEDGSFVSELMTAGEYVHEFDASGTFAFDCSTHPEMTGVVTVR